MSCWFHARSFPFNESSINSHASLLLSWVSDRVQVLHKFLQVFAAFDWDNYVLSMRGACPLSDLPGNLVGEPLLVWEVPTAVL